MKIHWKASRMQSTCKNSPRSPHDGFDISALQLGILADNDNYITALRRTRSAPLLVQHSDAFRSEEFDSVTTPKPRQKKHLRKKGINKWSAPKAGGAETQKADEKKTGDDSPKSGDDSPMTGGAAAQDRDQEQSPTAGGALVRTKSGATGSGPVNRKAPDRHATICRANARKGKNSAQNGGDTFSSK